MNDDFILKNKFSIYNNQANSGESSGRLSVTYNFYPAPAIFWEFETFDSSNPLPESKEGKLVHPFEGYQLVIPEPWFGKPFDNTIPKRSLGTVTNGSAAKVLVGNKNLLGKSFAFVLPNVKFQVMGVINDCCTKEVSYRKPGKEQEFYSWVREGFLEANLGNDIKYTMHTPIEAIDWLNSHRSTGTYITTSGTLDVNNEISITEAVELLEDITDLLSFANGGLVSPLIINMHTREFEMDYPSEYSAYLIDPVEHIGASWLGRESDIVMFLECFPSFKRMMQTQQWEKNYYLVLMWYFQAIQPKGIQIRGKPWPIAANALGAALEMLARIILVEEKKVVTENEFRDSKKMSLEKKIRKLLEVIGLSFIGPKYGENDAVWWFKELRNYATHSKGNLNMKEEGIIMILENAIQWVEEIVLWRLGYKGKYRDRWRGVSFYTDPRYDLEEREPSW